MSAYDIIINVDGEEKAVQTTVKTVGDVLSEQGITLDEDDEVSPAADTVLTNDLVIEVLRVEYVTREKRFLKRALTELRPSLIQIRL